MFDKNTIVNIQTHVRTRNKRHNVIIDWPVGTVDSDRAFRSRVVGLIARSKSVIFIHILIMYLFKKYNYVPISWPRS